MLTIARHKIKVGDNSPWGRVDFATVLMEGMTNVSTSSHGGIYVDRDMNQVIPSYMRREDGWYEEDCDWCIPFCVFECSLQLNGNAPSREVIANGEHRETLKQWRPAAYERYFGVIVAPGESFKRDEETFYANHADSWIVYSASRDYGTDGDVICHAGKGKRGNALPNPTRVFIVPVAEYRERGQHGFVIDLERHREIV